MDTPNSITVAIRVRPFTDREKSAVDEDGRDDSLLKTDACLTSGAVSLLGRRNDAVRRVVQVIDERVLVFDPQSRFTEDRRKLLGPSSRAAKDIRYCFDRVFDQPATQEEVYEGTAKPLVDAVLDGINATVFAYGPTGAGKSHTICGTEEQPGIIFLVMQDLFDRAEAMSEDATIQISISYLEIYNENIRDLLTETPSTTNLDLRETKGQVKVANLSEHTPKSAAHVLSLIHRGNSNRTTHATDANQVSSRSHAVLSVNVKRKDRTATISEDYRIATLSVIDLAGSERASVTNNVGARLKEGSKINTSLLALGNCINALCVKGNGHVPYRNSRLTRLLRHSLGGNCKTIMITCLAPTSLNFDETLNSLRYANRAKEIKTKVSRNVVTVERHVGQYLKTIAELQQELKERKESDSRREEKAIEAANRQRTTELDEIQRFFASLRPARNDAVTRAGNIAAASASLDGFRKVDSALQQWHRVAFSNASPNDCSTAVSAAKERFEKLRKRVQEELSKFTDISKSSNNPKAMCDSNIANMRRKFESSSARAAIDNEVALWKMQLELAAARAVERGLQSANQCQLEVMSEVHAIFTTLLGENSTVMSAVYKATSELDSALVGTQSTVVAPPPRINLVGMRDVSFDRKTSASPRKLHTKSPRKVHRTPLKSSFMPSPRKRAATSAQRKKSVVWVDEPITESDNEGSLAEALKAADALSVADAPEISIDRSFDVVPSIIEERTTSLHYLQTPARDSPNRMKAANLSNRMQSGFLSRKVGQNNQSANAGSIATAPASHTPPGQSSLGLGSAKLQRSSTTANSNNSRRRSSLGPMRTVRKSRRTSYLANSSNAPDTGRKTSPPSISSRTINCPGNKENSESPTLTVPGKASPRKLLGSASRLPSRSSLAPSRSIMANAPSDGKSPLWR